IYVIFCVVLSLILGTFSEYDDKKDEENHVYKPYGFGYEIQDGWGNTQYRHEKSGAPWDVKGSYGYKDAWGIFRHVDYHADKWGFRASIKTNEPGTAPKNPASVKIDSHPDSNGHKYVEKHSSGHHSESKKIETYSSPEEAPLVVAPEAPKNTHENVY
ncbi:cuticle-like protein 7, partial [Dinothrombium tinctorium]